MMIGQKPKVSAPDFTRSNIEALKRTVQGAPIIVDDLTNKRFNQHAIETIKNDDFGVSEHLTTYSAVVISANEDVKAVAPEVIRQTVICRVEAGLTNTEVMKGNVVRNVQQKKDLPETLEAHTSREWVVMNLEEAREFFGIKFKRGFWRR